MKQPLVEIKGLHKHFPINYGLFRSKKLLKAVDGVDLTIYEKETFGLVGESGCGKTTCGRTVLKLYEPTAGSVHFEGTDITNFSRQQMLPYRSRMQMIFQDPYASLNPRMMVKQIISEGMDRSYSKKQQMERVKDLLSVVGLAANHADRFPHEFSGGQRQRIGIARALAVNPKFIVCDEPISSLDVSIQAQIVNMLEQLQEELDLTYLFVAHDISMVKHISDRIGVMYLGKLVEIADSNELYLHPHHPYTEALLSAIPIPDPDISRAKQRIVLKGDVVSPIDIPPGCRFFQRCHRARPVCSEDEPQLRQTGAGHMTACHFPDE
ncbi:MAG: ATP-binding cassette domain-containing protein [Sphaerochaeta sp.]|nr:ATP-binding cassette domain-containing protein [Sphaerochaeta sp.]